MPTKDPVAVVWLVTHLAKLSGFNTMGVWDKNHSRVICLKEFNVVSVI